MAQPSRPIVGAAMAVGLGLAVSNCFAVAASAHGDAGVKTGARDAGVAPDAVVSVPDGSPASDSGSGDAGVVNDGAPRDAAHDTGVATACIDIVVTDAGLACTTEEDCTAFLSGKVCNTDCWKCEDETTPMNTAAAAQYQNQLTALPPASCGPCVQSPAAQVACYAGRCTWMMVAPYGPPPPQP
jgi:hypothetical protein